MRGTGLHNGRHRVPWPGAATLIFSEKKGRIGRNAMADWTMAERKAAARIFAQALPSLPPQRPPSKPMAVINSSWWPVVDVGPPKETGRPYETDDESFDDSCSPTDEVVLLHCCIVFTKRCMFIWFLTPLCTAAGQIRTYRVFSTPRVDRVPIRENIS